MSNNPLITVIVPVYNVEKYLSRCVDSIINQTYKNLEIILVDDGSTDSSPEICDFYAKKDSRVNVIHKQNGGVSSARNIAIRQANGEFIHFVDSDDWIETDIYEKILPFLSVNKMIVINAYFVIDGNKEIAYNFLNKNLVGTEKITDEIINGNVGGGNCWGKIFSTEILRKNGLFFDEQYSFGEDLLFVYNYSKYIDTVQFVDLSLYNYLFDRNDSASNDKGDDYYLRWRIYYRFFSEQEDGSDMYADALIGLYNELLNCACDTARANKKALYRICCKNIRKYYAKYKKINSNIDKKLKLIHISPTLFRLLYRIKNHES